MCPPLFSEASLIVHLVKESACNAGHPGLIPGSGRSSGEVIQSCPTLCDPMDCSPADSSAHGILQARILHWVVISSSKSRTRLINETTTTAVLSTLRVSLTSYKTSPHFIEKQVESRGVERLVPGHIDGGPRVGRRSQGICVQSPCLLPVCSADRTRQAASLAVAWEAEGGTERPRWFQEELC